MSALWYYNLSEPVAARIIDDSSWRWAVCDPVIGGVQMSRGHVPRDYEKEPYGESGGMTFEESGLEPIPRSNWEGLLKAQEENGESIVHLVRRKGIPPLNQNGTNYCWGNGPTQAAQIRREQQGHKFVFLSPASCCAIIKKGANQGGWGTLFMRQAASRGINSTKLWAPNDRNYRTLDNEESRAEALRYRVRSWIELEPRNLDQLMTALILGLPVAVGYNWWSHEVTGLRGRFFGGPITSTSSWGADIYNSWGPGYGDNGIGTLRGTKCLPDDACIPLEMEAYDAAA